MEMKKNTKIQKNKKNEKRGVGCKKGGMLCPVHKYLCAYQYITQCIPGSKLLVHIILWHHWHC